MKIKSILVAILMLSFCWAQAQERSDVFNEKTNITWLGLDFSGAKLIGDRERLGSESDIRQLINSWNAIIVKEPDKYDIALALDRPKVENAIEVTTEHNEELDVLAMYSDAQKDYLHLKPNDIEEIIATYDFKGIRGIGLMFNVESFSKPNKEASAWVTFINLDQKEVLFTERLLGEPGGAGLRNYWANAINEMITKIKKKEYEMWRKKYFRK